MGSHVDGRGSRAEGDGIGLSGLDETESGTPSAAWMPLTGRIVSGLVAIFLVFDGSLKLVPLQPVLDAAVQIGWPTDPGVWRLLGTVLIGSTILYVVPRTALVGAILITAYLGGAIATHARVGAPLFSHTLFGVYIGVLLWVGLWLRDPRLRAMLR